VVTHPERNSADVTATSHRYVTPLDVVVSETNCCPSLLNDSSQTVGGATFYFRLKGKLRRAMAPSPVATSVVWSFGRLVVWSFGRFVACSCVPAKRGVLVGGVSCGCAVGGTACDCVRRNALSRIKRMQVEAAMLADVVDMDAYEEASDRAFEQWTENKREAGVTFTLHPSPLLPRCSTVYLL
jgi:hypothetical protein